MVVLTKTRIEKYIKSAQSWDLYIVVRSLDSQVYKEISVYITCIVGNDLVFI